MPAWSRGWGSVWPFPGPAAAGQALPHPRDVKEIRGEFVAIDAAFANLKAGELCLILIDQVEAALGYIRKRVIAG